MPLRGRKGRAKYKGEALEKLNERAKQNRAK